MKLVHMHESLVWFPAIRAFVVTSPSNQELHGGFPMMVTTMCQDPIDYKFLLVLLSYIERIDLSRVEYKGSYIVNMSLDLLAVN
jgi:hypothetical protein